MGGRSDSDFEVVTTRSRRKAGGLTVHINAGTSTAASGVGGWREYREGGDREMMVDVLGLEDTRRDFEIERVCTVCVCVCLCV